MTSTPKTALLLIMDGFGHRTEGDDNAILHANTPHWDALTQAYPYETIQASEEFVGLPSGQFGNSEVGHLNIGAGRVVRQEITRIDADVASGGFAKNPVFLESFEHAKSHQKTLHILGLVSDGGVHSHETQLHALIRAAAEYGVPRIRIHAFLDGRDTPPKSAETYLARLEAACAPYAQAQIASLCGRFYAMDRDKRWERVESAYRLLTEGHAAYEADSAASGLAAAYARDEKDEFVQATRLTVVSDAEIVEGDSVIFMNFRADRARELTTALTDAAFSGFERKVFPTLGHFCMLTHYGEAYAHLPVAYPPQKLSNGIGEYLAHLGLKQLRIAETEKYPHVTYFFNGGEETPYAGEDRILVPSPKVATYDLKPEMSAFEVTEKLEAALASQQHSLIVCNYANGDMVGHTGNFAAAVQAVQALDTCLGRVVKAALAAGAEILVTADHGNCEMMHDASSNQPHTQHTTEKVPFLYIGRPARLKTGGALEDIAPTLLGILGQTPPQEMTGTCLIEWIAA